MPDAAEQAQRDTGTMRVRAVDPDGAPLPGVMVVARGPVGSQTQYTGIDGTARFPGLYPGVYTATFTLDGFKTVIREGLQITPQRTVAFDMTMELATVEETITVTADTPMLEIASPSNVLNVDGEFQRDMPIQARRNWSVTRRCRSRRGGRTIWRGFSIPLGRRASPRV